MACHSRDVVNGVQLSPSPLPTQPQALIATDTPRQLDTTGA